MIQPLRKTVGKFLKKLKIELPYDPAIPLLGTCLRELKTGPQRDVCTPMLIAELITIAKMWKQPREPLIMNGQTKCGPYMQWNIIQP